VKNLSNENLKLWNKGFVMLLISNFLSAIGFNMIYTLIVDYTVNYLGGTLSLGGIIAGIFSITALLIRPFSGIIADYYNKKFVCQISMFFALLAILGYTFSPNPLILLIFRIIHGIAFSLNSTTSIALVSLLIPLTQIGEGMGYFGIGQIVAQIIGPVSGEIIARYYGYKSLFLTTALINVVAQIFLMLLPYKEANVSNKKAMYINFISVKNLIETEVVFFAFIGIIFSFGNGIVGSFLKIVCDNRKIEGFSLFFSVNALVLLLTRIFIGKLIDKNLSTVIIFISLLITSVSIFTLANFSSLYTLLIAAILKALGQSGQIALQTECIKRVDENKRGTASSTFYMGADIGQGVGPWIGGIISNKYGYEFTFVLTAIATLLFGFIFLLKQNFKSIISFLGRNGKVN